MKRLASMVMVVALLCMAIAPALAESIFSDTFKKYLEHAEQTDDYTETVLEHLLTMNESIDNGESFSDAEVVLYFEYTKMYVRLNQLKMLEGLAMVESDDLKVIGDLTLDDGILLKLDVILSGFLGGQLEGEFVCGQLRGMLENIGE